MRTDFLFHGGSTYLAVDHYSPAECAGLGRKGKLLFSAWLSDDPGKAHCPQLRKTRCKLSLSPHQRCLAWQPAQHTSKNSVEHLSGIVWDQLLKFPRKQYGYASSHKLNKMSFQELYYWGREESRKGSRMTLSFSEHPCWGTAGRRRPYGEEDDEQTRENRENGKGEHLRHTVTQLILIFLFSLFSAISSSLITMFSELQISL